MAGQSQFYGHLFLSKARIILFRAVLKSFENDYSKALRSLQNRQYDLRVIVQLEIEKNAKKERELAEAARIEAENDRQEAAKERQVAATARESAKNEMLKAAEERQAAATEREIAEKERLKAAEERQAAAENRRLTELARNEARKERERLEHLKGLRVQSDRMVRAALRNLPTGFASAYGQILEQINFYSDEDRLLAEQLLKWIVCARRPLKVAEICCALAIEPGNEELDWSKVPANSEELLDACDQLIRVDETMTINLIHSTVASYLLSNSHRSASSPSISRYFLESPKAQAEIATQCVSYLSLLSFRDRISKAEKLERFTSEELTAYPFLEYTTLNWWKHVVLAAESRSPRS